MKLSFLPLLLSRLCYPHINVSLLYFNIGLIYYVYTCPSLYQSVWRYSTHTYKRLLFNFQLSQSPEMHLYYLSRATTNRKLKETVALELSFVNSNLQLLKEQLAELNSSVELYQNDRWDTCSIN
jgi:hypothetical protein